MKRSLSLEGIFRANFARHAGALCGVLLMGMSGAALGQTSSPPDPSPAPAGSSAKQDDTPPGGCKPIGLTVSGEVVFPLQCKEFIERQKALNEKPAVPETKPAAVEARPPAAEEKPAVAEVKPSPPAEKPAAAEDNPADVKDKPAAVEEKPATSEPKVAEPIVAEPKASEPNKAAESKTDEPKADEPKAAANPPEDVAPGNSQAAVKPFDVVPLPKRADRRLREHAAGPPSCTHFRTYNAASGTYRDYDGRTRACR
jgi:outer membrane biosynthesis protein TonB